MFRHAHRNELMVKPMPQEIYRWGVVALVHAGLVLPRLDPGGVRQHHARRAALGPAQCRSGVYFNRASRRASTSTSSLSRNSDGAVLDPEAAQAAASKLRPQGQLTQQEPHPLETWPDVPSFFIHCTQDRSHTREFDEAHARERLGVGLLEIDSGHSPFLSAPKELAAMLDRIAGDVAGA